ncbi:MAG TPA: DUF4440 domain-containing protein [Methylomirabilota bacterium]|nr:DUF4440 domain-containing protein [Methylomirabilota bacterium]
MALIISDLDACELTRLEESMWRGETRFDVRYMDRVLADDFEEFGRSGRRYTRQDTMNVAPQEIRAKLPLENLQIKLVTPDVALVTYVSEVAYATMERANRSSLWVRGRSVWRLRFHQGTPVFGG